MSNIDAGIWMIKATAATAAVVPASTYIIPMWGTTPAAFILAGIGAAMSYGWERKLEDTGIHLLVKATIVTLFSVALVVVVPDLANITLSERSEPSLAFIFALYGRQIIPALRSAVPTIGRGLAAMLSGKGRQPDYNEYQDFPTDPGPPRGRERDTPRDQSDDGGY